jgi:hypothetical protein
MKFDGKEVGTPAPEQIEHFVPAEVIEAHRKWMADGTISKAYLSFALSDGVSSKCADAGSSENFSGRSVREP